MRGKKKEAKGEGQCSNWPQTKDSHTACHKRGLRGIQMVGGQIPDRDNHGQLLCKKERGEKEGEGRQKKDAECTRMVVVNGHNAQN
jgi:hypothetical protein